MTVLRTDVSGDLHNATVYVSVMGTESEQNTAMRGLQSAAGFLQAKVAARFQTRTTPHLIFKRDVGVKRSIEMSQIIDDALAADRAVAQHGGTANQSGYRPDRACRRLMRSGRQADVFEFPPDAASGPTSAGCAFLFSSNARECPSPWPQRAKPNS